MSTHTSPDLESLKLRLITHESLQRKEPFLTEDGVRYLIKALTYADASFSVEIEDVLVSVGELAIPELVKGLASNSNHVRSVCAMVLIRLGQSSVEALLESYPQLYKKPSTRWVIEFVMNELNIVVPEEIQEKAKEPRLGLVG